MIANNCLERRRVGVLKRRRDYLIQVISRSENPLSWDLAEKNALDWAISKLDHEHASA